MSAKNKTVEDKINELEEILTWFESNDVTVDTALKKYEQAEQLASELEADLKGAKNKVEIIKKKFS